MEIDPSAAGTLIANQPQSEVYNEDVNLFLDRVDAGDPCYPAVKDENNKPTFQHLHASPPCPGFSDANRTGGKNDERNNELSKAFVRGVRIFRVETATMENVTGMLKQDKQKYWQEIVADLIMLEYSVRVSSKFVVRVAFASCCLAVSNDPCLPHQHTVVDSSQYGDPQQRLRVIIFACKKWWNLAEFPKPTHGRGLLPVNTVRSAWQDLEAVLPRAGEGRVKLADGTIVSNHVLNETEYSGAIKLNADDVAPTLTTCNQFLHYRLNRGPTIREYAR